MSREDFSFLSVALEMDCGFCLKLSRPDLADPMASGPSGLLGVYLILILRSRARPVHPVSAV